MTKDNSEFPAPSIPSQEQASVKERALHPPHEARARIVQTVFTQAAAGLSLAEIAAGLTGEKLSSDKQKDRR